ncbi:hypothetical protein DRE_05386 [Drechslerella stenobrocha 248]|uniref:Manganese lipoxygenase n=1 Tax=Drechslerella stenobrocha 248 TaxID=1043628 RepID=W7I036_9PEZI|nr:hypothetical protein DRE_05386 [Drechslerella stenobrocha 248]
MWQFAYLTFVIAASVAAAPLASSVPLAPSRPGAKPEPGDGYYSLPDPSSVILYSVRQGLVAVKRISFLYGEGIGGGPSSPSGALGQAYIAADSAICETELAVQVTIDSSDALVAMASLPKYNDLKTLDDYTKLYDGDLWKASSAPTGPAPGLLTNYTQDLLFSMERLSINPYAVRRLMLGRDSLPIPIDDAVVAKLTGGSTLADLLQRGLLFYADHSSQAKLAPTQNFAAACDAYFYISPANGQFLPLAIRSNVGNKLVYTPADSSEDWLLAKLMFNCDDFFMSQFYHLASTHFVTEVAYQAAIRTLSDDHPVLAILQRLMYGAFGIRPLAAAILLPPGGSIGKYFGWTGESAAKFSGEQYSNGFAGAVQGNYFLTNLRNRGLIDSPVGPALQNFPFHEDALVIHNAIREFMTTFVNSYYTSDSTVPSDPELQAWLVEANGPAGAIDFPTPATMKTRKQLIELLTHMGHLVSSSHHTVNTNQVMTGGGVLPFNPSSLYRPIPTEKGAKDIASFLPPPRKSVEMIQSQANFARPAIAGTSRTLVHMFDDAGMLARMTGETRAANERFKAAMEAQSKVIKARKFNSEGLSQGMPILWQALDPDVVPWSLSI